MLPLQRILCPTDFSDFSFEAIEQGAQMAKHFEAELCVLHVAPTLEHTPGLTPFQDFAGVDRSQLEAATREGAERELAKLIERHHLNGVRVRALAKCGSAADEIVSAAEEEHCDLIVIATHGLTGWREYIYGSVAEKVLRIARCPVLIRRVQAEEPNLTTSLPMPPRKILCTTDWSEPSFSALQVAGEWATHFGAELCLLHVLEPMESPGLFLFREQIEEPRRLEALKQLHHVLREQLPQFASARPIVRLGSTADEIATVAEEEGADLLIIATHGASGWRSEVSGTPIEHLLFGSVTTNVVRLTSCPLLTVRLPPESGAFQRELTPSGD
jgi:nucleotide-binding universal stress UspA family protein